MFKSLLLSQLKNHPMAQQKATKAWNNLLNGDKDALNPSVRKVIFDTVLLMDNTDVGLSVVSSSLYTG
jgi:aminopeptidase 2